MGTRCWGLLGALLLSLPSLAWAAWSVTLAWEAPTTFVDGTAALPADIAGYTLYSGTQSGVYPLVTDVGLTTQAMLGGLVEGVRYYARVAAYTHARVEGLPSSEVPIDPPPPPLPPSPPPLPIPPPGDTVAPTVSLSAPEDGGTVPRRETVEMVAQASDNVGVTQVELRVGGAVLCRLTSGPYRCAWQVHAANKRTYHVQARAWDAAGNVGVSAVHTVTAR